MAEPSDNPSIKPVIMLFSATLVLGFFTSHATMTLDPPARFQLTKSIVDYGDMQIRLDESNPDIMYRYAGERFRGPDGRYYLAFFGIGQALLFVPHYILLHHILEIDSEPLMLAIISATLFPLTLALTAWVFYALLREFGFSRRQGYLMGALVIFATGLWQVSKEGQEDSQLALFFALTAYFLRRYQKTGSFRMMLFSTLIMGFSFWTRSDIAPTMLCYLVFAAFLMYQNTRRLPTSTRKRRSLVVHLLPVMAILLVVLVVHLYIELTHYGKLVSSWDVPFSLSHLSLGLPGLLFSPGKGMFIYNPFFILSIIGLIPLWRVHREWAVFILAAFLGCLFLHAMVPTFHGNWCWGPRYLCRQIPLLFIAAAFFGCKRPISTQQDVTPQDHRFSPPRRTFFAFIMTISVLVQIAAVSGNHSRELTDMAHARGQWSVKQWTMFEPEANIMKFRLINLHNGVQDMINDEIAPWPTAPKRLRSIQENITAPVNQYLAFWPFHLTYYLPAVKPEWAVPLWGSTLILIAGVLSGLIIIFRGYPKTPVRHDDYNSECLT